MFFFFSRLIRSSQLSNRKSFFFLWSFIPLRLQYFLKRNIAAFFPVPKQNNVSWSNYFSGSYRDGGSLVIFFLTFTNFENLLWFSLISNTHTHVHMYARTTHRIWGFMTIFLYMHVMHFNNIYPVCYSSLFSL